MTITGGSSLPKEDIDRMVREAEEHAAEDKKRREAAELRNTAEQLAYGTEKLITDNAEKLPDDVKTDKLNESQGRIGEALYQQSQTAEATAADSETGEPAEGDDEDIVDAEVVDDEPEQK